MRTFGEPGKFWSMTNLYLHTPDGGRKFWCMWSSPPRDDYDPTLINMATTERTYGPQTDFDRNRLAQLALPLGAVDWQGPGVSRCAAEARVRIHGSG